jgi:hypothetical protein
MPAICLHGAASLCKVFSCCQYFPRVIYCCRCCTLPPPLHRRRLQHCNKDLQPHHQPRQRRRVHWGYLPERCLPDFFHLLHQPTRPSPGNLRLRPEPSGVLSRHFQWLQGRYLVLFRRFSVCPVRHRDPVRCESEGLQLGSPSLLPGCPYCKCRSSNFTHYR